jgi:hypothetical protein
LDVAKEEILWYFDHLDRDYLLGDKKQKKKDGKQYDLSIAELIWCFKTCWQVILSFKDKIIAETDAQLKINIGDITEVMSVLLLDKDITIQKELENLIKSLKEPATDYGPIRFSWLRFQMKNITPLTDTCKLSELFNLMTAFYLESPLVDSLDSIVQEKSSLKELYYQQNSILDHLKEILELSSPENLKYIFGFAMISSSFNENATGILFSEVL